MISWLYKAIFKFVNGGIMAFSDPQTGSVEREDAEGGPTGSLLDLMDVLGSVGLEATDPTRVIQPFADRLEAHMPNEADNRTEFIEGLLCSLTSLGEEIMSQVPESTITSSVDSGPTSGPKTIVGHLDWKIDKYNPLVYHICVDLLKDGFVFRADSRTFAITTRIVE